MKIFLAKDLKGVQKKDTVWLVYTEDNIKMEDLAVGDEYIACSNSSVFHNISVYTGNAYDRGESYAENVPIRNSDFIEDFVKKYPHGLITELFPGPINTIIEFCEFQCIQKCPENCSECCLKKFTEIFVLPGPGKRK